MEQLEALCQPPSNSRPRIGRATACDFCRLKKVKCSGMYPCTNCIDRNRQCVMSGKGRPKHKPRDKGEKTVRERLKRIEAMLQKSPGRTYPSPPMTLAPLLPSPCTVTTRQPRSLPDAYSLSSDGHPGVAGTGQHGPIASASYSNSVLSVPAAISCKTSLEDEPGGNSLSPTSSRSHDFVDTGDYPQIFHKAPVTALSSSTSTTGDRMLTHSVGVTTVETMAEEDSADEAGAFCYELSNWEYHGPKSYLSICSGPGVQWVVDKMAKPGFRDIAATFVKDVTRRLKTERKLSRDRVPDPDATTAWRYTQAYFNEANDAGLGIIHRPWFEARLKSYFEGPQSHGDDDDPGWYALRNTIYASGCRIELSKTQSLKESNEAAWGWFENALSAHTEILYFRTSMVGIQALTTMAYFCENIASPCLEYMLCANALRLAISKGLHRQPKAAKLSQEEQSQRSLVFWAAYCLEKHIVSQSGRPSILDDQEISCQIPSAPIPGSSAKHFYYDTLIKLAQLSSASFEKLFSHRASHHTPRSFVDTLISLDQELEELKELKQQVFCLDTPIDPSSLPASLSLHQVIYLQYAYHITLLDIHTALAIPWSQKILTIMQDPSLAEQLELSAQKVARSCRSVILATKHINIDASTPHPLTFVGPISAAINLFMHILRDDDQARTRSDLALLNVCAGHFARLEFATASQVSFPFVSEVAALARENMRWTQSEHAQQQRNGRAGPAPDHGQPHDNNPQGWQGRGEVPEMTGSDPHPAVAFDSEDHPAHDYPPCPYDEELMDWTLMLPLPNFTEELPDLFG